MCNSALGLQMHLRLNYLSQYLTFVDNVPCSNIFTLANLFGTKNSSFVTAPCLLIASSLLVKRHCNAKLIVRARHLTLYWPTTSHRTLVITSAKVV